MNDIYSITIKTVCNVFGVAEADLLSEKRLSRQVAQARQAAMWIFRTEFKLSQEQTGKLLGREHTTVLYGEQEASQWTGELQRLRDLARVITHNQVQETSKVAEIPIRTKTLPERVAELEQRVAALEVALFAARRAA